MELDDLIEQAKTLQSMLNGQQQSDDPQGADDTVSQLLKILQATQQTKSGPESYDNAYDDANPEEDEETNEYRLFDEAFSSPSIKAVKAAMRYVDPKYHQSLGVWIKFLEIQNLIEACGKRAAESYVGAGDWRLGMLKAIRPHVSEQKQAMLDFMVKAMELKEIINRIEERR
ncbi:MAG: hypothetical protein LBL96_05865 [Clostridiales bacterium]|nr:hypothetical protein [Clostridiales bacterium]